MNMDSSGEDDDDDDESPANLSLSNEVTMNIIWFDALDNPNVTWLLIY